VTSGNTANDVNRNVGIAYMITNAKYALLVAKLMNPPSKLSSLYKFPS
jgi:hypothetical protein